MKTTHLQTPDRSPTTTKPTAGKAIDLLVSTGVLVEMDRTEKMFSNPSDELTENYVTGRFG